MMCLLPAAVILNGRRISFSPIFTLLLELDAVVTEILRWHCRAEEVWRRGFRQEEWLVVIYWNAHKGVLGVYSSLDVLVVLYIQVFRQENVIIHICLGDLTKLQLGLFVGTSLMPPWTCTYVLAALVEAVMAGSEDHCSQTCRVPVWTAALPGHSFGLVSSLLCASVPSSATWRYYWHPSDGFCVHMRIKCGNAHKVPST